MKRENVGNCLLTGSKEVLTSLLVVYRHTHSASFVCQKVACSWPKCGVASPSYTSNPCADQIQPPVLSTATLLVYFFFSAPTPHDIL